MTSRGAATASSKSGQRCWWTEPVPGSYLYRPIDSTRIQSRTLFELLSERGARVATVNLPLTYPERYKFDFIKSRLPNNTEFMSFLRYRKKQDNFNKVFIEIYKNDLRTFITDIVNKSAKGEKLPF